MIFYVFFIKGNGAVREFSFLVESVETPLFRRGPAGVVGRPVQESGKGRKVFFVPLSEKTDPRTEAILQGIADRVTAQQFATWFSCVRLEFVPPEEVRISVPNRFHRVWIEKRYRNVIVETVRQLAHVTPEITIAVDPSIRKHPLGKTTSENEGEEIRGVEPETAEKVEILGQPLNPNYTFENFVVGPSNHFCHAAAVAVAAKPGDSYNPLFIHGNAGLGKTHLLQALCHVLAEKGHKICYLSCEDFTNQYITAMRTRALDAFRKRFRGLDLLVLDDVHFLTNKPATQEEFLHTFNALVDGPGKQVVLASDSHPRLIAKLKESLMTRFVAGMVARIDPPDEATRLEILRQKSAASGVDFAPGVLEFLAQRLEGSVRELEGALTMLVAHARLARREVNLVLAREVLARLGRALMPGSVGMDQIAEAVAAHFGLSPRDLRSASRRRSLTFPRQVAMFLARRHTGCSLAEIGEHFGGRDHSTAAGAIRRVQRLMKADPAILRLVEHLEGRLRRR